MDKYLLGFVEASSTPSGIVGHCLGVFACLLMLATLVQEPEAATRDEKANAQDIERLFPETCEAVFDHALRAARKSGVAAWVWADESPAALILPDSFLVTDGIFVHGDPAKQQTVLRRSDLARPAEHAPVPGAVASDGTGERPSDACRFASNAVHVRPKAS
ncbi:hypothetical protein [Arenibaculum pallidiluteum]|uniref:hypothetical protein n=1 Tax=Arenibaculum pallidiluteum TaxID=2812559 RepID=UPI001A957AE6|nr:hypothetical protein [Arenibaculum pallidiluteum]